MKLLHLFFLAVALGACSDHGKTGFSGSKTSPHSSTSKQNQDQSPNPTTDSSTSSDAISGNNDANKDSNLFAIAGKSLDVYFVIDASNSLNRNDPNCLRFTAFQLFQEELKKLLGPTGDVRATLVLFSSSATLHSTRNDFLKLSAAEISSTYRSSICSNSNGTNVTAALNLAVSTAKNLQATDKKDISSALFFTDGRPSGGLTRELTMASDSIKASFPSHVYSLLLGTDSSQGLGSPLEFVTLVAGSKDRVRSTVDPSGLSTSILSFIKN